MLGKLSRYAGTGITEFKMRDAYSGRHEWSTSGHASRDRAIEEILNWLNYRHHSIVFSATQKQRFAKRQADGCPMAAETGSRWVSEALHVSLAIQKENSSLPKNKGKTILIFDKGAGYEAQLSTLLVDPPEWTDAYYNRNATEPRLGEIFTTSLFADSQHAPLIQIADTVAFILRRLAELRDAGSKERFSGERKRIEGYLNLLSPVFQASAHRFKKRGRCACADYFFDVAPPCLRSIP